MRTSASLVARCPQYSSRSRPIAWTIVRSRSCEAAIRAELRQACGSSLTRSRNPSAVSTSSGATSADEQRARARDEVREAGTAEHADERGRRGHEARQAREPGQRHQRDDRDPGHGAGREHPRPPVTHRDERQRPGDGERERQRPAERLARIARPRLSTAGAAAAGAEQLRSKPQQRHAEHDGDGERAGARVPSRQHQQP